MITLQNIISCIPIKCIYYDTETSKYHVDNKYHADTSKYHADTSKYHADTSKLYYNMYN